MGKLLSWVLLIAVGYLVFKLLVVVKRKSEASAARQERRPGEGAPASERAPGEAMVQCARCGVHLPQSEALDRDGRHYCSADHRDAG